MRTALLRFPVALSCAFVLTAAFYLPAQTPNAPAAAPAYTSDPHYVAAIAEAKKRTATREYAFAIDAYKKANKIAGGRCFDCVEQIATLEMGNRDNKAAVKEAQELISISNTPLEKSIAKTLLGTALLAEGGEKPKPTQLEAAHQAFQAALADLPGNNAARFNEGKVLARMGQMDAARKMFEDAVAQASPTDPYYIRAKHFADNPALSYAKMAPAFTVNALDGSNFTLDQMGGRVVLIDFWATWCGPCNEELPHMKKIAREFAGQPLVIISISWDSDEAKWRQFITKNEMGWVQYRDANHELSRLFGIDAIPHYFTIDSDGVLTSEMLGSGSDVEGKLKKLIARAKAAPAAPAPPAPAPAS